ncbi:MAG: hypothetical protein AUK54_02880 [Helicobacteraceae bacterium CG2_30_36_10]|nr:MAG: hypothetical protein AUK54_02880 [Helicobacteraceae bacterium CG2_30_36_10]
MNRLAKIFLAALLGAALLQGAAFEKTAKTGATQVELSSEKPLTSGKNTLTLVVLNEEYKDAAVSVKAFMPAMPGMPHMESLSEAVSLGKGKYRVDLNLAMRGTWQLHIFITPKEGKKVRVKSSLNL